jgi:hypothetical protein
VQQVSVTEYNDVVRVQFFLRQYQALDHIRAAIENPRHDDVVESHTGHALSYVQHQVFEAVSNNVTVSMDAEKFYFSDTGAWDSLF